MLLRSFHLVLQIIVVCQDVVGANEKSSSSMYVMPSYANDHGHNFYTSLVGTYHMVGSCRLVVLMPNGFDASRIPTSLSEYQNFDKAMLFITSPFGVWSCNSSSRSHVPPPPLLIVPNDNVRIKSSKLLCLKSMIKILTTVITIVARVSLR